ncbi:teichuronic acid biosynthesis protein TuaH [Bacillus sp. NPDC077027]|uniref:teichuronic acid biosynthesis protein TuaH n=1 Tax=Bacillus sp. NPDC077027 TaxID=3390548 RepID=UPI003D018687
MKVKSDSIIHVIVATGEWGQDGLRYRRHRLAEFLASDRETKEVIWVCPSSTHHTEPFQPLTERMKQFTIPDVMKSKFFRFGRYQDMFYINKLSSLLAHLRTELKKGISVCLWYTFPGFPLLSSLFEWKHIVYDCSDLWGEPISGKNNLLSYARQRIILKAENRIIKYAHSITCSSQYLHDQIKKRLMGEPKDVFTVENGVEYDVFAKSDPPTRDDVLKGRKGTVLGFIGGIKPKLDFELIQKAALIQPEWTFLFVGPDGTNGDPSFQHALKLPNVIWTGAVDALEVPSYMKLIDVGIMPYKQSPYNKAVFPLKLFEFLAAGKPVVGLNLPSTEKLKENDVYEYLEGEDPAAFVAACKQVVSKKGDVTYTTLRQNRAKKKDWHALFTNMVELTNIKENA